MKFNLNLVYLSFLGEELYTTNINFYPMLIIEFMKGYYTTKELYKKNNILINENLTKKLSADSLDYNLKIDNTIKEARKVEKRKESTNSERTASISLSSSVITGNIDFKLEDEQPTNTNKSKKRESGRSSSFAEIQDSEINLNKEKNNKNKISIKNKIY